ncbi:MAG: hypothetical protein QM811_12760 [Pirellulales bacterium]
MLINGLDYAGTGVGYNQTTGKMDKQFAGRYNTANTATITAPNPVDFLLNGNDPTGDGGANESYDAPDFQNPFLAYFDLASNPTKLSAALIKPSFHDPALIAANGESLLTSFRPLKTYHPNFTGSNPNFYTATNTGGLWDVDNDGDGVPDSIWIDPGFPVQVAKDGRLYKRLIAPLILDLDGRVNLNTAGTTESTQGFYASAATGLPLAGSPATPELPRGFGYGPADVNLAKAFNPENTGTANQIMVGASGFEGRYGSGALAGPTAGYTWQWLLKGSDIPPTYAGTYNQPTAYIGGPPDVWGRLVNGIDWNGSQLFGYRDATTPIPDEQKNLPYAINLSRDVGHGRDQTSGSDSSADNPFSVAELERVLRGGDMDASSLPNRLTKLIPEYATTSITAGAKVFTTDSWDTPVTASILTQRLAGTSSGSFQAAQSFTDLLQKSGKTVNAQNLKDWFPPELLSGRKMLLNRPLGNGKDDSTPANGVVDDFAEAGGEAWNLGNTPFSLDASSTRPAWLTGTVQLDLTQAQGNNNQARQKLAQHLYCLMLFVSDANFRYPLYGSVTDTNNELTKRRIAQWAVNVVDYMDGDNIMTPFEYDINPWNGWDSTADGVVEASTAYTSGEKRLVWGCEAPALMFTEAFALHDRRVRDSKNDDHSTRPGDTEGRKRDDNADGDADDADDDKTLDQALIPRGPAFIELRATHAPLQPVASGDLYETTSPGGGQNYARLKLDKLTPNSIPVWRIVVLKTNASNPGNNFSTVAGGMRDTATFMIPQSTGNAGYSPTELLDPALTGGAANVAPATIDRIIVFPKRSQLGSIPDANRTYCHNDDDAMAGGTGTPYPTPQTPNLASPENLLLYGGQYVVLYPQGTKGATNDGRMGYLDGATANYPIGGSVMTKGSPSTQRIQVRTGSTNSFTTGPSGCRSS